MTGFLRDPDPSWTDRAAHEIAVWQDALGTALVACHHIGSTAVPDLAAKPILDLLPVVTDLDALTDATPTLVARGYEAMGAFGLPGRRYFRKSGPDDVRRVHAHAYASGDPAIARHLAFRDILRDDAATRLAYEQVKRAADVAACGDVDRYMDLKDSFIKANEARALSRYS